MSRLEHSSFSILKKIFQDYVYPYRLRLLVAITAMLVVAVCNMLQLSLLKPVVDRIFIAKEQSQLLYLVLMVALVTLVRSCAEYIQGYLIKFLGQRILTDIQILLYGHLLQLDTQFILGQSSGRLLSRFTNDISLMRGAVSEFLVGIAMHFFTVILLVGNMFYMQAGLAAMILLTFPIAVYPIQKIGMKTRRNIYAAQEGLGDCTARLDEVFQSIVVVKSYNAQSFEHQKAKSLLDGIFAIYSKNAALDASTLPVIEFLSGLGLTAIIGYGGYLVIEDYITTGTLVTFVASFLAAYRPFKSLMVLNVQLQEGLSAAVRIFELLDRRPEAAKGTKRVALSGEPIVFDDVWLELGGRRVLSGVSLTVQPRQTVAFVGRSGAGKSSLCNLLLRIYDPTSGTIRVGDGDRAVDLCELDLVSLRSQIALVTQHTHLFHGTVAQNIAYNADATMEQIRDVAQMVGIDGFIASLPQGYDTPIGANGLNLSGGQRQRLAICRAILKDAPVIVFDEATSSLDAYAERDIQRVLDMLHGKKTVIVVTHKLNKVRGMDRIFFLKDGRVTEQGNHEELLALRGSYAHLCKSA